MIARGKVPSCASICFIFIKANAYRVSSCIKLPRVFLFEGLHFVTSHKQLYIDIYLGWWRPPIEGTRTSNHSHLAEESHRYAMNLHSTDLRLFFLVQYFPWRLARLNSARYPSSTLSPENSQTTIRRPDAARLCRFVLENMKRSFLQMFPYILCTNFEIIFIQTNQSRHAIGGLDSMADFSGVWRCRGSVLKRLEAMLEAREATRDQEMTAAAKIQRMYQSKVCLT